MTPLLPALLALQPLHDLPRTGWILRGIAAPESVADHILSTAWVALALSPRIDPPVDAARVLMLTLLHDAPEALTGDLPRPAARLLPPGAKTHMEAAAARLLLEPLSPEAHALWREYAEQATREARFVRTCDRLQLGLRLVGYHRAGHRNLDDFRTTLTDLDCSEFPPAAELKTEILAALTT
jgi:putative hydrolase of HD superfamily